MIVVGALWWKVGQLVAVGIGWIGLLNLEFGRLLILVLEGWKMHCGG